MKKITFLITSLFALSFSAMIQAEERPDHFKGKPSETLEQAVANFSEYNGKLADLLAKDALSLQDLHQVHELTYTLENALEKLNAELTELANTLEAVHVASENGDAKTTKEQGARYLDTARKVIK
ncbi:hypothetical protein C8R30_10724 [Nitrosomonas nitrosa]|uniref:Soluble cytochrome b562 n=1 Tax=Nitrosomonas nitrosa TaxID=52442 RepID=A0A1I4NTE7_9PROT|nr:DUF6746 family protein [Nitrosomonas nitrosa]PTR00654.1 hypothetical protein C8R30_10724 [Nitrosomonas nitrosa]CAE6516423.1 conserved exported hypothetical protein [Nitrosomonas nitrosa]SFM18798.1 hypothetical protein SAMN05421880_1092 [Nitrosomonas nitrosa]